MTNKTTNDGDLLTIFVWGFISALVGIVLIPMYPMMTLLVIGGVLAMLTGTALMILKALEKRSTK